MNDIIYMLVDVCRKWLPVKNLFFFHSAHIHLSQTSNVATYERTNYEKKNILSCQIPYKSCSCVCYYCENEVHSIDTETCERISCVCFIRLYRFFIFRSKFIRQSTSTFILSVKRQVHDFQSNWYEITYESFEQKINKIKYVEICARLKI